MSIEYPISADHQEQSIVSTIAASMTSKALAENNPTRRYLSIFNNSSNELFVKFGTDASSDSFTVKIGAGGYFEATPPVYTKPIEGAWAGTNGNAMVTELY